VGRDRWSAVGLALLAIGYLLAARRYPLDTLATPGPGIFPVIAGVGLLAAALWQLAAAAATDAADGPPMAPLRLAAPAITGVVLILYAIAFPRLGFLASSFALVAGVSRLMGLTGWWRPAALALRITAASHVVFARWLGVPLP
jgi:putative tricarboxylic transport membrane protein